MSLVYFDYQAGQQAPLQRTVGVHIIQPLRSYPLTLFGDCSPNHLDANFNTVTLP